MSVIAPLSGFARRARRMRRGAAATPFAGIEGAVGKEHDMAMRYIGIIVPALVLLLSLAAAQPVESQVPGASDYAACNREAPQAAKAGTDSPTKVDHVRADRERAGVVTTKSTEFTGKVIESSDPQIHGMEAEGAKDATYQAAYRSCMRRKGF